MKQSFLLSKLIGSLFVASLAFAGTAQAGSDIKKCVAADGQVTLTDDECPGNTRTSKIVASSHDDSPVIVATTAAPRVEPAERYTMARMPARYVNLMKSSKPTGGLSLDSATLRAARVNMRVIDTLRGQRMASLQ